MNPLSLNAPTILSAVARFSAGDVAFLNEEKSMTGIVNFGVLACVAKRRLRVRNKEGVGCLALTNNLQLQ